MTAAPGASLRVLGVRHHGPGSARAVRRALEDQRPEVVLVEGPADADALVGFVPRLVPPVALLGWRKDDPTRSAWWPFAVFSPEWQALAWAAEHGVPVRFIDLPTWAVLASDVEPLDGESDDDPVARLAAAAGYDDPEAWWEDVMELRAPAGTEFVDPFDALTEAMSELRRRDPELDPGTLLREAHMRCALRAATGEFDRVAVVCGAWHAPALSGKLPPASADAELLRGLPTGAARGATEVTWTPWAHSRLAQASGYGAGIASPGWYHHLFTAPDQPVARWLTRVAGVLREHDLPVSSADVIEAVRLAEALASLRGRPVPGLPEVTEATWSVMCGADPSVLDLVTREAVVGEVLGDVPPDVPTAPLDADLRATAKGLRLRFEALERSLTLDLRRPLDLARSRLFHRLGILDIDWARPTGTRGKGASREGWTLAWRPELAVRLLEANRHGSTIERAATHRLVADATDLAATTSAVERALVADLAGALAPLLRQLDRVAADERDVVHLLDAVPPLARASRYGDARHTDTDRLAAVARHLLVRACAGFGVAASGIDDERGRALQVSVDAVQAVVALLGEQPERQWRDTLLATLDRRGLPGSLEGRLTRLLSDVGELDADEVSARLSRALSPGHPVQWQAAWMEGLLTGSPLLLLHDPRLLRTLDDWVRAVSDEAFVAALPVVRRAFGQWDAGARRQLATRVAGLGRPAGPHRAGVRVDSSDDPAPGAPDGSPPAGGVLDTVAQILGGAT